YCGEPATTDDHVVPSALYPPSKGGSRVQRITVDTCDRCNGGWASDEVHFRNMLVISGPPNPVALALWRGRVLRSFEKSDGRKRTRDLVAEMVPTADNRHMVYPARDERVMRIVRKVARGLCHHHGLRSPVPDGEVWADHHRYEIPPAFLAEMMVGHVEEDIF